MTRSALRKGWARPAKWSGFPGVWPISRQYFEVNLHHELAAAFIPPPLRRGAHSLNRRLLPGTKPVE
jgi:hypothetical protein